MGLFRLWPTARALFLKRPQEKYFDCSARSVKFGISKTAALVKCSRAAVVNDYKEWIPKQKIELDWAPQRLLKDLSERRIGKSSSVRQKGYNTSN
ncbi:hypothetical protein TNCV_4577991 [Trichonephila clavipes]|nr:hypothetical protein TNCV_4577991 [Trichonephila clavipes]